MKPRAPLRALGAAGSCAFQEFACPGLLLLLQSFLFFAAKGIPRAAEQEEKTQGQPQGTTSMNAAGRGGEGCELNGLWSLAKQRSTLCGWFSTNFILMQ